VFVCKPTSHTVLAKLIEELDTDYGVEHKESQHKEKGKSVTDKFRFVNNVPLNGGSDAIDVNWCEVISVDGHGKELYKNSFATSIELTQDNVAFICEYGRSRWKIENENNNTLKNLGYNLEHNFGHGKQNLASVLATFNILAFLMHSAMEIVDDDFRQLVDKLRRSKVFKHAAVLTCYICYGGWQHLVRFMLTSFDNLHEPPIPGEVYYHPSLITLPDSS
jgi:hypothetical protein